MNVPTSKLGLKTSTPAARFLSSRPRWVQTSGGKIDAYWRAANYLSVGQIYLYDNPHAARAADAGSRQAAGGRALGNDAGAELHLCPSQPRRSRLHDLDMIYIAGPGHGGPALVANTYLEGSYSEIYPDISQDEAGMKRLFKQFSFPGGISSHVAPSTPGSIHEGGELGYSLSHAFGAAFDNPGLIVACIVGDGEAETGPAGDRLAVQQVSRSDLRRRGAADPASQRLQDQQPDDPRPHRARGTGEVLRGLRLDAAVRRGRRAGSDAPADGGDARRSHRPDSRDSEERAREQRRHAAALADDRAQIAEGLDRAEGRRRPEDRRHVSRASGADARRRQASRPCQAAGKLDEELQGGRTVRRQRNA